MLKTRPISHCGLSPSPELGGSWANTIRGPMLYAATMETSGIYQSDRAIICILGTISVCEERAQCHPSAICVL